MGPVLTLKVHEALAAAARKGGGVVECSLDLDRTRTSVEVSGADWVWEGCRYPLLEACKDRTIYYWAGAEFAVAARYSGSLIKLVPTEWGAPTFEIDGIKMLPTAKVSPYEDAQRKVALIRPRWKAILDTCGGLGYFAAWCLQGAAGRVVSFEKNADVVWLRGLNPWSPKATALELPPAVGALDSQGALLGDPASVAAGVLPVGALDSRRSSLGDPASAAAGLLPAPGSHGGGLTLIRADVSLAIAALPDQSFDAVLHDPPRFGIAGELYSQVFYDHLARVMRPRGVLFHYTGSPNKLTTGRDVPNEVAGRLRNAGFSTELHGDGVLATRAGRRGGRGDSAAHRGH